MKITAIKSQVKSQDRLSIFVDEKYSFSLTTAQILEEKIFVGLEIDKARLSQLKQASDFGKNKDRIINYISIRPRSEKEIRDYAWRKKISPEDTDSIIRKLRRINLIDDYAFAKAWVNSRKLSGKISLRKLKLELRSKGVDEQTANRAIGEVGFIEDDSLQNLIAKKSKLSRYQDKEKLTRYLVSQGFSYSQVKAALDGED